MNRDEAIRLALSLSDANPGIEFVVAPNQDGFFCAMPRDAITRHGPLLGLRTEDSTVCCRNGRITLDRSL